MLKKNQLKICNVTKIIYHKQEEQQRSYKLLDEAYYRLFLSTNKRIDYPIYFNLGFYKRFLFFPAI